MTFFKVIGNRINTLVGNLRNMQQTITTRQYADDSTKIKQLEHCTFVNLANFDISGNRFNACLGGIGGIAIDRRDSDRAIFLNVNLSTSFFGNRTDHGATLANHVTNLLGIDLHRVEARRIAGNILARGRNR